MSEQSLDALLDRIAVTLAELMPYEALHIYEADESAVSSCRCSPARPSTRKRS